jgi:hypothetical protein
VKLDRFSKSLSITSPWINGSLIGGVAINHKHAAPWQALASLFAADGIRTFGCSF